jgi:hypothetical protein
LLEEHEDTEGDEGIGEVLEELIGGEENECVSCSVKGGSVFDMDDEEELDNKIGAA